MSRYTGKCDLYDCLMMMKIDNNGTLKDEFECFEIFKKATKGVIYQRINEFRITDYNIDMILQMRGDLVKRIEHKEIVSDKRCKSGTREKIYYTYTFLGREYNSIEELSKNYFLGFKKEIKIDSILDLIPYYPYIISIESGLKKDNGEREMYVEIANESYLDERLRESSKYGSYLKIVDYIEKSRQELQRHYIDVVNYINTEIE